MNLRESVRISWRSITSHKLRSALTTLGVVIGVASVITFMVLGSGFSQNVVGDVEAEQEPVLTVTTQMETADGVGFEVVDTPIYTESDVDAIAEIDGVEYVAPEGSVDLVQIETDEERLTATISAQATTAERFEHEEFREGEPFASEDEMVVDERTSQLFEGNLSAGDELTVTFRDGETATFVVAGVVESELEEYVPPQLYVPADPHYNTTIRTPGGDEERAYPALQVGVESIEDLDRVREPIAEYLDEDSHAAELKQDEEEITIQTLEETVDQFVDIVDQLTLFIGAIAGIALVVGSIGIANIMIVSVTERTRQIGIMKAVGARRRDVMQLFLVESIILGMIGAVCGVVTGLGAGYLLVTYFGWPMAYPFDWIAIAIVVGIGVGILSGLYPAWRAARVDPIEALRHE